LEGKPVPQVIAWESTRACRFTCRHCRANAQTEADPGQLSTEEALRMVDEIAEFSKPLLIISGGDPLLRKDIFEIAAHADKKGLKVVMSPSGSVITSQTVDRMKSSGVRMVSISIDGADSDTHDGFRNVEGSFNMVLNTLETLRRGEMPFQINTTVTQHNLKDLQNIFRLAVNQESTSWDIFMLVPTGRAEVKMEITAEEYEETLKRIYEWNMSSPMPIKMTCAPHYMRIIAQSERVAGRESIVRAGTRVEGRRPSSRMGGRGCMAGNGFCFISNVGEVYGCGFLQIKAGDVRKESFKTIYQESPLFESLRNHSLLQGRCGVCEFRTVCGGCRARALGATQNFLGEEPYCTYNPAIERIVR